VLYPLTRLAVPIFNTAPPCNIKKQKIFKIKIIPSKNSQGPAITPQEDRMDMNLTVLLLPAPMKDLSACTEKHTSKMGSVTARTVSLVRYYLTNLF
jgi:hypothetical protein